MLTLMTMVIEKVLDYTHAWHFFNLGSISVHIDTTKMDKCNTSNFVSVHNRAATIFIIN